MVSKKDTTKQNSNTGYTDSYHARVTQELKQQGKTQQWLANQLGKHRQYIRQILKMASPLGIWVWSRLRNKMTAGSFSQY